MDMQRIGSFLAQLRKERNMTQEQLGQQLGVSNKTVSRWENGNYMPPVEMLQELSRLYGVSINEILSAQRLSGEDYKEKAEENIKSALHKSPFTLREQIRYYKKKWTKDHLASTVLGLAAVCAVYGYGLVYRRLDVVVFGWILVAAFVILRYNVMMAYVEGKAFDVPQMKPEAQTAAAEKRRIFTHRLRRATLLILAVSIAFTADLGYNFFAALVPEINDGLTVRGVLAPLLFGDDLWSLEAFFKLFADSFKLSALLGCISLVLAVVDGS